MIRDIIGTCFGGSDAGDFQAGYWSTAGMGVETGVNNPEVEINIYHVIGKIGKPFHREFIDNQHLPSTDWIASCWLKKLQSWGESKPPFTSLGPHKFQVVLVRSSPVLDT